MPYVTREELIEKLEEIKQGLETIRENDLHSIEAWLLHIEKRFDNLRWYVLAGAGIISVVITIVLAILEVRG